MFHSWHLPRVSKTCVLSAHVSNRRPSLPPSHLLIFRRKFSPRAFLFQCSRASLNLSTMTKETQIFYSNFRIHCKTNEKYNCSAPPPRPHLKVKEQEISLTKGYDITINIKIISSIHIFIFKMQVLGSHELKSHCHF